MSKSPVVIIWQVVLTDEIRSLDDFMAMYSRLENSLQSLKKLQREMKDDDVFTISRPFLSKETTDDDVDYLIHSILRKGTMKRHDIPAQIKIVKHTMRMFLKYYFSGERLKQEERLRIEKEQKRVKDESKSENAFDAIFDADFHALLNSCLEAGYTDGGNGTQCNHCGEIVNIVKKSWHGFVCKGCHNEDCEEWAEVIGIPKNDPDKDLWWPLVITEKKPIVWEAL